MIIQVRYHHALFGFIRPYTLYLSHMHIQTLNVTTSDLVSVTLTHDYLLIDNGDDADSPMTPKKQSVSSRWAQTLEESKNHELNKFSNKKKSTLEAFQITKGDELLIHSFALSSHFFPSSRNRDSKAPH